MTPTTRFIDVPTLTRLIAEVGTCRFIGDLADAIEADFRRWPDFDKVPRLASHSGVGVIELMPVAGRSRYAFKYVNGHPANTAQGLYTVMAFGVPADVDTGYPVLLSEMTIATALRTAATSLVAARAVVRPGVRRMALIGNGAQSEFQAIAFHAHLGIDEIAIFDTDPRATDKLERNLAVFPGLRLRRATGVADAVRGADIVTTVTADKRHAAVLTPGMIEPGMHINAVGGDCPGKTELHPDVLRAARVVVEYEPQTRVEGDIQLLPGDYPVVELWRVLTTIDAGREGPGQVTVFDSVGFALEDYSTLCHLYREARARQLGVDTALVPEAAEDPKDLFGHIRRGETVVHRCESAERGSLFDHPAGRPDLRQVA